MLLTHVGIFWNSLSLGWLLSLLILKLVHGVFTDYNSKELKSISVFPSNLLDLTFDNYSSLLNFSIIVFNLRM